MKKVVNCAFYIDKACMEVKFEDRSIISINCPTVEDEVADNVY